jgi:iron complex outermembrane receptor protein
MPWYAEAGVTYRGSEYNDLANTSERPSYARWDASVGWRPMPWVVTLAVTNLTDERYWRSTSMPGAPRSVLVSTNYVFQ